MKKFKSIALVDDDHIVNMFNQRSIENLELAEEVLVFEDAHDLHAKLQEADSTVPDLIFLDLSMPRMDGFTFVEKFIELGYDVPSTIVLAISAELPATLVEQAHGYGIRHIIEKPLKEEKLLHLMKVLVSN